MWLSQSFDPKSPTKILCQAVKVKGKDEREGNSTRGKFVASVPVSGPLGTAGPGASAEPSILGASPQGVPLLKATPTL